MAGGVVPSDPVGGDVLGSLFPGESELAGLMRSFAWDDSPLGPPGRWPQSLRTSIAICLGSRFPILLWWSPEHVMLYNDAYRPMLGQKHPHALGRPGAEVWPEIWRLIGPMLRGVVERGEATWSDDQLLPLERNGYVEECYFTFSYSPIGDERHGVGGIFTAVTETTERVLAQRRLQTLHELGALSASTASERDLCVAVAELLSGRPDTPRAAIHLAVDGGVETAASTFERPDEALAEAARAAVTERAHRQVDTAEGAALVLPISAGSAPIGALATALNPRRALDDAYRSFLALVAEQVGRLIAGARALEEERHRAEELARLDQAKTMFFSNVSHELRTPLTLILGPLDEAVEGLPPGASKERDLLDTVRRNAGRLLRLVNTLLTFSRLDAARLGERVPTDLKRLTEEVASAFAPAIETAHLRFAVECEPIDPLPVVDPEAWQRIVSNLLSNAFKYTLRGEIGVRLEAAGDGVRLMVSDTGAGISAGELPHLFERFFRGAPERARSHEGTGIGLALAHELAAAHGGTIEVESEVGRGSTFTVSIPHVHDAPTAEAAADPDMEPLREAVAEAASWAQEAGPEAVAADGGHQPHVLVVDDNADMRRYLTRLLETRWPVEACADGEEALRAAHARRPALVLTDLMMPRLDGFGLLRALRADPRTATIPVIAVSARAGEERAVEGLEAGADDYLVKPFSARELMARVAINIELAELRVELGTLNALDEVKTRVLTTVSHELRTPVTSIYGALATIDRLGSLDEETRGRLLEAARSEAERLAALTDDLLDAASLTSGMLALDMGPVDVRPLADAAVAAARATAPEAIRLSAELPDGPLLAWADGRRLQQVLANLLDNAVKYSPDGGLVIVRAEGSGDAVTIAVEDEGVGIPAAERETVFERFYRLDPEGSGGVGGIGLGLHICRELVETMGGRIWVEANADRGSRFVVRLGGA